LGQSAVSWIHSPTPGLAGFRFMHQRCAVWAG
jgi:hypothetical protein